MNLLRLESIRLKIDDFRLEVNTALSGSITGLFGPSGAGKTSLLELIAGLRKGAGRIMLGSRVLCDATSGIFLKPEQRQIGYVPQDLALFPHQTVRQNLLFASAASKGHARFEHVVDALQLQPLLQRSPAALSGGEKQRVALGRALMSAPELLLLDEPLANLDPALTRALLQLLKSTVEEFATPMLYVSHDANELSAICDDVIVLEAGKIAAHGPFHDLFRVASHPLYERASP